MRLNIPDRVTPQNVFHLIAMSVLPSLSLADVRGFDEEGRRAMEGGDFSLSLPLKVAAAKGFKLTSRFDVNLNSGFCWDRAARAAYCLVEQEKDFSWISLGCTCNAAKIYKAFMNLEDLSFVKEKRLSAAERALGFSVCILRKHGIEYDPAALARIDALDIIGNNIQPEPHDWFSPGRSTSQYAGRSVA